MSESTTKTITPALYLDRTDDERELASLPTAASILAACEMWDRYAPSHLRGLLKCQVAVRAEAPPSLRATKLPSHASRGRLALFGCGVGLRRRYTGDRYAVFTYNPQEARDKTGEWTTGGSVGAAGPAGLLSAVPPVAQVKALAGRVYSGGKSNRDLWEKYQGWADALSEDDRTLIDYYQKQEFDPLNNYLRGKVGADEEGGPDPLDMDYRPSNGKPYTVIDASDELQDQVLRSHSPADMRLWRGGHLPPNLKPGDIVQDDGFVSTSLDVETALGFNWGSEKGAVFEVDVPKGSPAASLDAANWAASLPQFDQSEVLLPHGSTFAYLGDSAKSIGGKRTARLLYLGPMPTQPGMAHFAAGIADTPASRFLWQDGDLRIIAHHDLGGLGDGPHARFVFNPEEARDEAGRWTIGGPHAVTGVADEATSTMWQGPAPVPAPVPTAVRSLAKPTTRKEGRGDKGLMGGLTPFNAASVQEVADALRDLGGITLSTVASGGKEADQHVVRTAASVIVPVFRRMKEAGLPLPRAVAFQDTAFCGEGVVALYQPRTDAIYVNADSKFWQDPTSRQRFMDEQVATKWFSTPTLYHVPVHELAHEIAEKVGGDAYKYGANRWSMFDLQAVGAAARKVSRYAATRPHEYVAEVLTGLLGGVRYPEDVMDLYKKMGGPEVALPVFAPVPAWGVEKLERADPWESALATVGKRAASGAISSLADLRKPRDMMHEALPKTTPDGKEVPALPAHADEASALGGFLHKLGIQDVGLEGGVPKGIGGYVAPIMQRLYAQGFPMPRSLNVVPWPTGHDDSTVAWYDVQDDSLNINRDSLVWKRGSEGVAANAEVQHDMGFWSTGDPSHPLVHEMGHLLARRQDPDRSLDYASPDLRALLSGANEEKAYLAINGVSRYAMAGKAEFVAETFAGLYSGHKYSAEVMKLYKAAGGPPVTWRDGSAIVDFSLVRITLGSMEARI